MTQNDVVIFSFAGILFPSCFSLVKVLTRHIFDGHPMKSVINIISGCPFNN